MFPNLLNPSVAIRKNRHLVSRIIASAAVVTALCSWTQAGVVNDTETLPPFLTYPAANAETFGVIEITFTLQETAQPGSVKLKFGETVLTLAPSMETPGVHSFLLDPRAPGDSSEVASVENGPINDGTYTVTLSYKDSFGNAEASDDSESVIVDAVYAPDFTELYKKGGAVPGAGDVEGRIQVGAVWTGFGSPTINDAGNVAFIGKWKAPSIPGTPVTPAQSGTGIFVDGRLVAKVGENADGAYTFKTFRDPVLGNDGKVAFVATVAGFDVDSSNDTVIARESFTGSVRIVAQEGHEAPGTGGAVFRALTSVSIKSRLESNAVVFTGTLRAGTGEPTVVSANDSGAWMIPYFENEPILLIREGVTKISDSPTEYIKSFSVLKAVGGSPAQGRGHTFTNEVVAQVTVNTGIQAIVSFKPYEVPEIWTATGAEVGNVAGAEFLRLGFPSVGRDPGDDFSFPLYAMAMYGTMKTGLGGVTSADSRGIFEMSLFSGSWDCVARVGDYAGGFDETYKSFKDPVHSPGPEGVAVLGTVSGGSITNATNDCLWWMPYSHGPMWLIAREGFPAPTPEGAVWKSFSSVVLPGDGLGPVFTGNLQRGTLLAPGPGGVTSIDDLGLYATLHDGNAIELVRENRPLLGKKVKNFRVLKASAGSAGVGRSHNSKNSLVLFVTYGDSSTAIVRIDLPRAPSMR